MKPLKMADSEIRFNANESWRDALGIFPALGFLTLLHHEHTDYGEISLLSSTFASYAQELCFPRKLFHNSGVRFKRAEKTKQ